MFSYLLLWESFNLSGYFSELFVLDELSLVILYLNFFVFTFSMSLMVPSLNVLIIIILYGGSAFFVIGKIIPFLFTYELVALPIAIIILGWGYQYERLGASEYFLGYIVLFGAISYLFIFELIATISINSLFSLPYLYFCFSENLFLTLVFLVNMPIFGLHYWLPNAHVEASTIGSIQLAGILLNLGSYGLKRIITLLNFKKLSPVLMWFAVFLLIVSISTLFQSDSNKLIGYISVCHINLLILFLLFLSDQGEEMTSAISISHGAVSSNLFYLAGEKYGISKSRIIYFIRSSCLISSIELISFLLSNFSNMGIPVFLSGVVELKIFSVVLLLSGMVLIVLLLFFYFLSGANYFLLLSFISNKNQVLVSWSQDYLFSLEGSVFLFCFFIFYMGFLI